MTANAPPVAQPAVEQRTGEKPVVELRDVTVRLEGRAVLHDLNFDIRPGEFVGVIGPNGAGKSTLLRVLLGLIKPASGTIRIFGKGAARGNPRIGYVPQSQTFSESMPLRARDMVALGIDGVRYGLITPSRARSSRVDQVLREVRAESFADAPIARLSGGEQQRLMLAQALVGEPDLLLLDEPLANLDLRSRSEVVDLVCEVSQRHNIAVLFVAHDVNPLLESMDRVLYIANSQAIIGPVDEVVQSDVLTRLFGFPVHVIRTEDYVLVTAAEQGGECHA